MNASKNLYNNTPVNELNAINDFQFLKSGEGYDIQFTNPKFSGKNGLVLFYADWCPHCQDMVQDVVSVAERTQNLYPIGAINVADKENSILGEYFNITGYPTIKYLDYGQFKDYTNGRDAESLLNFICAESGLCNLLPNPNNIQTPE